MVSEDSTESSVSKSISPITIFILGAPVVVLVLYLAGRRCYWLKARAFCKKQEENTVFNRLYLFVDGSLLLFLVSSIVTLYDAKNNEAVQILNFCCSVVFTILAVPIPLALTGYLFYNFKKLRSDPIFDRIGEAYASLKNERTVLIFYSLSLVRRIALGFMVTLGRKNLIASLLFMNYSSLVLIAVIATVRPFSSRSQNVLEIVNEFSILLLLCHCVTQTEFVEDPEARWVAAWSLNSLIILNVVGNMGFIMIRDGDDIYHKLRHLYLKRQHKKSLVAAAERQKRIDDNRKMILKTFASDLAKENQLV